MKRKRLLLVLLAFAAAIVAAMLAVLLLAEQPFGGSAPAVGGETQDASPVTPQVTLPLAAPTAAPTIDPEAVLPSGNNTPTDTVKRYLDRWNAKDAEGMEACLAKAHRDMLDYEFGKIDSVEILRIAEQSETAARANFPEGLSENAHAVAIVLTDYTVHYSDEGKAFFMADSATREEYTFWLTQEAEDGPWLIELQGY